MSSISTSSEGKTQGNARGKAQGKADAKSKAGSGGAPSRSQWLAVQDELDELADVVALLPELQRFAAVLEEIVGPSSGRSGRKGSARPSGHDRIGELLRALPQAERARVNKSLGRLAGDMGAELTTAEHMDLMSALNVINTAVHYRLKRLSVLMAVV